jgi:LIVCS family branched-chain amino acid:cation transporter
VKSYLPGLSLGVFSVAICGAVFLLAVRPQRIIRLLGVVLTPLLLLTLASLVTVGSVGAPEVQQTAEGRAYHFCQGLKLGYQTTDLLAALLFATVILPHLSQGTGERRIVWKRMTLASLIASSLLMASYIGLCWISAHHSWTFPQAAPEELLHRIAVKVLGSLGGLVASAAVFLACLTTAISLAAVFTPYLREELAKGKIGNGTALAVTLGVTAVIANLGFGGIVKLWGPLLDVLYPALIVLCLYNMAHSLYRMKAVRVSI